MRLQWLINTVILLTFLLSSTTFGQSEDTTAYKIKHAYRTEYSPYFKFNTFKRGELKYKLSERLDSLNSKNKHNWTRKDSFNFAQANLLMGNYELSEYYFNSLNFNPQHHQKENYHHLIAQYVYGEYQQGLKRIYKLYPRVITYSKIYFIKKIFEARVKLEQDKNWYKKDGNVFKFRFDATIGNVRKNSDRFKNEIIIPLKNATYILELFVLYIHEDDPIIACAFNNVGEVLEKYVSLSQAYIAYNIGRQYNKRDKKILENIKEVKAKLNKKHYRIPNFRKYFPKIKKNHFDYEILKEKIFEEQMDTLPKHKPKLINKKNDAINLPFSTDLIVPIGLMLIFFMLLIFLKTRKK
jgi:hypothetical protein